MILSGSCLDLLPKLAAASVNLIICDPPYGTTANTWDVRLPFELLWPEFWRVLAPGGAVLVFGQQPFASIIGAGQLKYLKYEWIWEKGNATGFLNARRFPLKAHENVLVFARGLHPYFPQMSAGKPYRQVGGGHSSNYGKFTATAVDNAGTRFPRSVLRFSHERGHHPTQKPTALYEYLIRTYTRPGEMILDPCGGSGTAAVAAIRAGREYTVMEREPEYCRIARQRVKETLAEAP